MLDSARRVWRTVVPESVRGFIRRTISSPPPEMPPEVVAKNAYKEASRLGFDSLNEWIRKSSEIEGWLFPNEPEFLWELATRSSTGNILEIGTWMGKSACIFAGACKLHAPTTKVICIDTFQMDGTTNQVAYHKTLVQETGTFYQFLANATRLDFLDVVVPVAAFSNKALPVLRGPFRLVFVDGAHDRIGCKADVELVLPHISVGGVLAIHDSVGNGWPEVTKLVNEELTSLPNLRLIDQRGTVTAFEKTS